MTTAPPAPRPAAAHHQRGVHDAGLDDLHVDRADLGRVVPLHRHRAGEPRAGGHHLAARRAGRRHARRSCPGRGCGCARRTASHMVALSIIWVGIPFTLFPLAEQHINSAVTGLLNGAVPMFTAIFGLLFFGRRTTGPQLARARRRALGRGADQPPEPQRGLVAGARRGPRAARHPLLRPGHQPGRAAAGPLRIPRRDGAHARPRHDLDAPVRPGRASPTRTSSWPRCSRCSCSASSAPASPTC